MRNIWAIIIKEMKGYFVSPIAYVVVAAFLCITGFLFFQALSFFSLQSLQFSQVPGAAARLDINATVIEPTLHNMNVILLLMIPLLTMKLLAEEKRHKTIELLLTSPISIWQLVLGKYLASFILFLIMMLLTSNFFIILFFVSKPDWGPLLAGYMGKIFLGGTFLAIGFFASSITENQIIAAVVSFSIMILLWMMGWVSEAVNPFFGQILEYLSIIGHQDNFLKGLIDTRDVVYYLSFIAIGLLLSHQSLESLRWR